MVIWIVTGGNFPRGARAEWRDTNAIALWLADMHAR